MVSNLILKNKDEKLCTEIEPYIKNIVKPKNKTI